MTTCTVHFEPGDKTIIVPAGTMIAEAARLAGVELNQPCGGQGRCGRCAVIVDEARSA
ncbi:MAG: 2Fe-2S iron-sulfur cluster-binding protein, partial [Anaerolineae bacterium]